MELAQIVLRDFPAIGVIAMSGFEDSQVSQLREALGIDAALTKPMHPEALIAAVREVLERTRISS